MMRAYATMLASAFALGVLGFACSSPSAAVAPPPKGRIAFYSDRDGVLQIYAMRPDGTDAVNLSKSSAREVFPDWSPSGAQIAFASARDENWEIYVMNADGTGERRLTDDPAADMSPAWSPDGGKIAFQSDRDGVFEIYVMDADGSNQTRLTESPAVDTAAPACRPPAPVSPSRPCREAGREFTR